MDNNVRIVILELINLSREHHEQQGGYCNDTCPYTDVIQRAEGLIGGAT